MTVIVLFMVGLAVVAGWWLSHQRLMTKPWLEQGEIATGASPLPTAKVGLGVFLAVAGSLFALVISAYAMRMALLDWRPLPVPKLLWFNTGVLILSSAALQWAKAAARREDSDGTIIGVTAAAAAAIVFLVGQVLAWRELSAEGYFAAANPANAFFYLITAIHGLHMAGGLVALGRTAARAWRGVAVRELRLGVELCTIYWHFLLLVWLVLFALLTGWMTAFFDICRQLIS